MALAAAPDLALGLQGTGLPWTEAFTRKLRGNVQLVAPTISCVLVHGVGPPALDGVHDHVPHFSYGMFGMSQARPASAALAPHSVIACTACMTTCPTPCSAFCRCATDLHTVFTCMHAWRTVACKARDQLAMTGRDATSPSFLGAKL